MAAAAEVIINLKVVVMEFSELKIKKMLSKGEFIRVVAFGASNTQRYMPGMHWFDCVEMGFKNRFGRCFRA